MNNRIIITGVLMCASVLAGCVSVEKTRAQLNSNDPVQVKIAEENILKIVSGKFVLKEPSYAEDYVELAKGDNKLLGRILREAQGMGVKSHTVYLIDPESSGTPNDLLIKMIDEDVLPDECFRKLDFKQDGLAKEIVLNHPGIARKYEYFVFEKLNEGDCIELLNSNLDLKMKQEVAKHVLNETKELSILEKLFDGEYKQLIGKDGTQWAAYRIVEKHIGEVTNEVLIAKLLKAGRMSTEHKKVLMRKLSEDGALKYALEIIGNHTIDDWRRSNNDDLYSAISVASVCKKPMSVVMIATAVVEKILSYRKSCSGWGDYDDKIVANLVERFPVLQAVNLDSALDKDVENLMCISHVSWRHFLGAVSPNLAYNLIVSGKASSREMEISLAKKLTEERADIKVYDSAKFADTKKTIYEIMPSELKNQIAGMSEKAFADILAKSKVAAKETFALDGFYLGMSFDDMKVVFAHHFPEMQIKEARDGEGEKAAYVIYIPGQSAPFCYAGADGKKVYQFNFGKKTLKKWYKYDVQSFTEWAHAYSREEKIDMRFKMLEEDTIVIEPIMNSDSYHVWFHQETYQFKHNAKEYRLTYFGEEKEYTFEGGIGGAIIKKMAAHNLRYVRGDPGSLRVQIDND